MKRKIILLILVIIIGSLAWRFFVKSFSQEPIEIIVEEEKQNNSDSTEQEVVATIKTTIETSTPPEEIKTEIIPAETKVEETPASISNDFIINKKVSWGYASANNREINTIVIHSSYDALGSAPYSLEGLTNEYKQYGVAPHFLIDRKGKIYRLVNEKNIAYHAGVSETPDGKTGVNNFSIGIELMNTKEDDYTKQQYDGLNNLINYLENQYSIKYVLGHEDISPNRKTDPWNFDWDEINSKKSIH